MIHTGSHSSRASGWRAAGALLALAMTTPTGCAALFGAAVGFIGGLLCAERADQQRKQGAPDNRNQPRARKQDTQAKAKSRPRPTHCAQASAKGKPKHRAEARAKSKSRAEPKPRAQTTHPRGKAPKARSKRV